MPSAAQKAQRMAIHCALWFVALNAVFYFLSQSYFASHLTVVPGVGSMPSASPDEQLNVRIAFAVSCAVVAAFVFLAGIWRRPVAHLLAAVLGVGHLVGAVVAFASDAPSVVWVTLLVSGVLMPVLAVYSARGARAPWAFLIALCGVFAVVELFGAPKIKGALGIGFWTELILPSLNVVVAVSLALLRSEYIERDSAAG